MLRTPSATPIGAGRLKVRDRLRQNCPEWRGTFVLLLTVTTSNKGNHEQRETGISTAAPRQRQLVQGTFAGGAPAGHEQAQGVVRRTGGEGHRKGWPAAVGRGPDRFRQGRPHGVGRTVRRVKGNDRRLYADPGGEHGRGG